ncbi:MAG: hypothetical protein J2P48_07490 [Alphaproteobacteria bacterium]|nr:hypothetical protein [Alphaproteobacteria bacterium]
MPPARIGRVSLVEGNVDLRVSDDTRWVDGAVNQPVYEGEALRSDSQARAGIEIGANTLDLANGTEIKVAALRDRFTQIALSRGRVYLHLRQFADGESVEIDLPQGGVWLLARGVYDIDAGSGDQPPRISVFQGKAQFAGAAGDWRVEDGQTATSAGPGARAAKIAPAVRDEFAQSCGKRDYDVTRLASSYYVSSNMTGFAELDAAGVWKSNPQYGPVWFPTTSQDWVPYRFGHWNWMAPFGWTWIDDQPWGFAPSHYGRWAFIDGHWAWAPGSFVARPLYAPGVVAFLGTRGVGLSSEDGAAIAWFPLAPGEAYWPVYTRDLDYVRTLNRANVPDVQAIRMHADGSPPLEVVNEDFANRQFASVVLRSVFVNGRPVAPARIGLPEQRLQDAPVLMGSPQIGPPSARLVARVATPAVTAPATHVATSAVKAPATHVAASAIKASTIRAATSAAVKPSTIRVAMRLARKAAAKSVRAASLEPRRRGQPAVPRGAHLRAPSYAGQPHGRQTLIVRAAQTTHGGVGKETRH